MKDKGFLKIDDWHLNENGRLDINYPSSISNVSGVIAILVNNEPTFFSSTSHYGPRIEDFKHSINGNTTSARIHSNIIDALEANKTVSLWVKNSTSPATDKGALLRTCNPNWNFKNRIRHSKSVRSDGGYRGTSRKMSISLTCVSPPLTSLLDERTIMKLEKIIYSKLNAKAKEMYNFQKASAKLADYGFTTMWLNNDWQGADFIAIHTDGVTDIKVQLKGRLSFDRQYIGKDIFICFITDGEVYLYPHDLILEQIEHRIADRTWIRTGRWNARILTNENKRLLEPYLL